MMNEEEYLKSKVGNRNPFTVPEGYFEQLAQQVMDRIPATTQELKPAPKKTVFKQLRPWLYAAACVCVGVFTAGVLFNSQNDNSKELEQMATLEQENINYYSDNYIDEEADYAMFDNQEIYACLLADM
ncbi:MAG: hypothetical protein IJ892_09085 [Prevotella sp.]|nr:hypothetical protein [Prevotella sp.]